MLSNWSKPELLVSFFTHSLPLLAPHGSIIVTLFEGEPYTLWNIRDLGRHAGLQVERSFKFQAGAYPGYRHSRTLGVVKNKSGEEVGWRGEERESRSYVFVRKGEGLVDGNGTGKNKGSDSESSESEDEGNGESDMESMDESPDEDSLEEDNRDGPESHVHDPDNNQTNEDRVENSWDGFETSDESGSETNNDWRPKIMVLLGGWDKNQAEV
jgi:25S rRNA (uracil2634-N3)-methyltransferase